MQNDGQGGFRTPVTQLLAGAQLRLLERTRFQHRLSTAGQPIHYELMVAVKSSGERERPPSPGAG